MEKLADDGRVESPCRSRVVTLASYPAFTALLSDFAAPSYADGAFVSESLALVTQLQRRYLRLLLGRPIIFRDKISVAEAGLRIVAVSSRSACRAVPHQH